MVNKELKRRIIEIAHKHKLSHLGSYLSCVDPIKWIFQNMHKDDIFILSNGHAALALYVNIENKFGINAEELYRKHGGHPHLDEPCHIYCSTGSLGMGLAAAIGRAAANPSRIVHVMISDGECAEGVVWESLRFMADRPIKNIKVYIVANGYAAYDVISIEKLEQRIASFNDNENITIIKTSSEQLPFLIGLNAHYKIMNNEDYNLAIELLK